MKVEVAVLGSPSLIIVLNIVSVDVKQHWKENGLPKDGEMLFADVVKITVLIASAFSQRMRCCPMMSLEITDVSIRRT